MIDATSGATITVTGAIAGTGQFEIGAGSEVEFGSATGEAVIFTSTTGKLQIDNLGGQNYTGTIRGFGGRDILHHCH